MKNKNKKRIFLDYASVTPVDKKVVAKMEQIQKATFANPSALYREALVAKDLLLEAREKIAQKIHAQKGEIIFTSGGTESNNLSLLGVFEKYKTKKFVPHFITITTEHPAILEVFKEIERRGGEITILPVGEDGIVSLKELRESVKNNTVLVSVSYVNNEIGTIQPIHSIARAIKDFRQKNNTVFPYLHTDACQAGLYLSLDVLKLGVDLMTLDGIKMYGPRSSGILYIKSGVEIHPIVFGGGQERGLRSGTENVAGALGLSLAFEIADKMRDKESLRLSKIQDYGIDKILKTFPGATLNGGREYRLPNNINICFPGLDAEFAVISLDVAGISASYSSSCRTLKEDSSSYVVESLGKKDCSKSSLRFSFGRETKKSDIDMLITSLKKIVL
ncbi:MAG: Aminotran 5 protein [Patescibacteria group bacterium]|jgi:cysteine desulfurase|nr:Aminotran 5 protein [Patescibacteria group bacterium]